MECGSGQLCPSGTSSSICSCSGPARWRDVRFPFGLESDDFTLVLKLGLSTRQDGRTVQIVRCPTYIPGPDTTQIQLKLKVLFSSPRFCFPLGLEFMDRH